MKPTQYDSSILQKFADDLYAQAGTVIASTAIKYGIAAFLVVAVGNAMMHPLQALNLSLSSNPAGFIAIVAAAVGVNIGRDKAFQLKLQAQQILCQRQIELNTRTGAASGDTKALGAKA